MERLISICIPIWNRKNLFLKSLNSIVANQGDLKIEISVFEDRFSEAETIDPKELGAMFPTLQFTHMFGEWRFEPRCPVLAANTAVNQSRGDIVCVSAAEIYHWKPLLAEVKAWVDTWDESKHYFGVAPAINLDQEMTKKREEGWVPDEDKVHECRDMSSSYYHAVPKVRWSVHPIHAPTPIVQFCVMPRRTWDLVKGFDLAYDEGNSWADQDFLMKMWQNKVPLHWFKNSVIHPYHGENYISKEMQDLGEQNKKIFEKKWGIPGHRIDQMYRDGELPGDVLGWRKA